MRSSPDRTNDLLTIIQSASTHSGHLDEMGRSAMTNLRTVRTGTEWELCGFKSKQAFASQLHRVAWCVPAKSLLDGHTLCRNRRGPPSPVRFPSGLTARRKPLRSAHASLLPTEFQDMSNG